MGNSSSYVDDNDDEFEKFDGLDTLGYRVLGVQPDSPASNAGLVSFFDFMVGVNGKLLLGSGEGLEDGDEYDDVDLPAVLKDNAGKELELLVYNIKCEETRLVTLIPSDSWGGAGLLGVTIRLDNYGGADERLIRILTVEHNSPASIAGLVPEEDYLLGTVSESLENTRSFAALLSTFVDTVVELYVYNTQSDVVRVVPLMPTLSWGGRGLLGAEVGTGYLHRLPQSVRNTTGTSMERKVRYIKESSSTENTTRTNSNTHNHHNTANHNHDDEEEQHNNSTNGGKTSSSRKNTTAPKSGGNLEHEPQLELEASEEGGPVTLASPDDVADYMKTTTAPIAVENTTEQESTEGEKSTNNNEAEFLFAGPPPPP